MHRCAVGLSILALCPAAALAGESLSVDLLASADGEVQFSGTLGFEAFDANPSLRTARSGGNNVRHAIYEFDLSSIPAGATVTGATLRLTTFGLISNTQATANIDFFAWQGDGAITVEDHGDQAMPFGSLIAQEEYDAGAGGVPSNTLLDIPFDSLSVLQSAIDDNASFLSVRSETFNFATFQIHSLETTNSAVLRPTLVVEYVPTPGAAALLALGGLAATRRRR